jgi:hypothetical protein
VAWQVRTQDPERAEVTAYRDGVWLGRAIVPVDAIVPARHRRSGTSLGFSWGVGEDSSSDARSPLSGENAAV